ncbi:hypothetical protein Tco_1507859 [Tanacetum coccineum]
MSCRALPYLKGARCTLPISPSMDSGDKESPHASLITDGSDNGNGSGGEGDLDLLRDDDGKGDSGGEDGDDNLALLRGGSSISSAIENI